MNSGTKAAHAACAMILAAVMVSCSAAGPGTDVPASLKTEEDIQKQMAPIMEADPDRYIELPNLSGITIEIPDIPEVTEKDVDEEMERFRESHTHLSEIKERDCVRQGDIVNIDYHETPEGEKDGSSAEGYNMEIGRSVFVPEVEKNIEGMKKGETKVIRFTYPDDYYDELVRGKDSTITVTVNLIQEKEEIQLDDETIPKLGLADSSGKNVETVEGLRAYLKDGLKRSLEQKYKDGARMDVISAVREKTKTIRPYTKEMTDAEVAFILDSIGMTMDEAEEETISSIMKYTDEMITEQLIVSKISSTQNITVTDEDVMERLKDIYEEEAQRQYDGMTPHERYVCRDTVLQEKVADYLLGQVQKIRTTPKAG